MKSIYIFFLICFNNLFAQNNFLEINNFVKIDSLDLYRKDKNTEIAFYAIKSNFNEINMWNKAQERGIIHNLNIKTIKNTNIVDFNTGQSRLILLYNFENNCTNIISFRFYVNDNFNSNLEKAMFEILDTQSDFKFFKDQTDLKNTISEFVFKPINWSEISKIKMIEKIKQNNFQLQSDEFIGILNSYQIASGNKSAIGQILAIKDLINSGNKIIILNWKWGQNVIINNTEELGGFIQSYDPVIDIFQNEEFK